MALTDNLIAYYKLDEISGTTANPSVGSVNGTVNGGGFNSGGKINYGFYSTNTTIGINPLTFGNNFDINYNTVRSMNFWVKFDSFLTTQGIISKQNSGGSVSGFAFYLTTSKTLSFGLSNTITYEMGGTIASAFPNANEWYMLTMTYSGNNLMSGWKIYINGTEKTVTVNKDVLGARTTTSTNPLTLQGYVRDAGYYNLKGYTDEFGIWDKVLTSTEVTTLYNGGLGLQYPFSTGAFFMLI